MSINQQRRYISLLLLHAGIGVAIFSFPFLSKIYSLTLFGYGIYFLLKTQNKNNEALVLSAYVVGAEVLFRMTDGMFFNEYAKYSIMIFLFIGMIYTGFSKNAYLYWFFLILLIPGIVLSTITLSFEANIRKAIAFNISGPVCLGVTAIYCYRRNISLERLKQVLSAACFPLIAIVVYLYLYTPSVKDVVTNTQSNFETSGGFGPNQMATVLGLGIFLFFVQMLLHSPTKLLQLINAGVAFVFAFRGLVTFSRGGIFTGIIMVAMLLVVVYSESGLKGRTKITVVLFFSVISALAIWTYSSLQTGGLIDKRYANEDASGRKKTSQLTGREVLIESEFEMFLDHPFLGVGVGKNKEYREELTGIAAASHNEFTRMLAEHGSLGLLALVILLLTPLVLYLGHRQNIFALPFLIFWLLTINHAAMRIAAPAFIYALSLLKVHHIEKTTVHRE